MFSSETFCRDNSFSWKSLNRTHSHPLSEGGGKYSAKTKHYFTHSVKNFPKVSPFDNYLMRPANFNTGYRVAAKMGAETL